MMYGFEIGVAHLLAEAHSARLQAKSAQAEFQRRQRQNQPGDVIDVEAREVRDALSLPAPDEEDRP